MLRLSAIIRRSVFSLACIVIAAGLTSAAALAQQTEGLRVSGHIGEMVEIGVNTTVPNPQFSWILTKDRAFISAQRSHVFQTRLAEPGMYNVDVSIQAADRTKTEYFTLLIDILPTPASDVAPSRTTEPPVATLMTDPPADPNGSVHLLPAIDILGIDGSASKGQIVSYAIDFDTQTDSDGDGEPSNDVDNRGSTSERTGSRINVIMQPVHAESRQLSLTVTDADGRRSTALQRLVFDRSDVAVPTGNLITAIQDGLNVQFSLPENIITPGAHILPSWDFGDRSTSLLTNPQHSYSQSGTYVVSVRIYDLATGNVVAQDQTMVSIFSTQSASSASSAAPADDGEPGFLQSFLQKLPSRATFFIIGGAMLLLIAIAAVVMLLLSVFRRKGGIHETLAKMEQGIVGAEAADETAPHEGVTLAKPRGEPKPAEGVAQQIIEREMSHQDFKTQERDTMAPATDSGPVPSWLTATPAAVKEEPKTPPESPSPETKLSTPVTEPAEAPEIPDWLKPPADAMSQPSPQTPPPAPPALPPAATPQPSEALPDWLTGPPPTPSDAPAAPPAPVSPQTPPTVEAKSEPTVGAPQEPPTLAEVVPPPPSPKPERAAKRKNGKPKSDQSATKEQKTRAPDAVNRPPAAPMTPPAADIAPIAPIEPIPPLPAVPPELPTSETPIATIRVDSLNGDENTKQGSGENT